MATFSRDQKMALLAVPILLFSIMGVSYADQGNEVYEGRSRESRTRSSLHEAVKSGDFNKFEKALVDTPFEDSADEVVFEALRHMYSLHARGEHGEADTYFADTLQS